MTHHLPHLTESVLPLHGSFFITGTDTEVGKTTMTMYLVKQLVKQGKRCYAIKPVTAGLASDESDNDFIKINRFSNVAMPLEVIAPVRLSTPCSPHIAANIDKVVITAKQLVETVNFYLQQNLADCVFVEGAGGWFTPINDQQTLADVAIGLKLPIILVVGVQLGCLNHAVLTLQAIWQAGLSLQAVIFNQSMTKTAFFDEQIAWLKGYIGQQYDNYQANLPLMWVSL